MSENSLREIPLQQLVAAVYADWPTLNTYAAAYLHALDVHDCEAMTDEIGTQEAGDVLRGFLANAAGWRGDQARAIKAELRRRLRG